MSVLAWIILGLFAGFIASKLVNHTGMGVLMDTLVGVVGAVIGGFLFHLIGAAGVTGFNLWSLLVAACGAMALLWVAHAIQRA